MCNGSVFHLSVFRSVAERDEMKAVSTLMDFIRGVELDPNEVIRFAKRARNSRDKVVYAEAAEVGATIVGKDSVAMLVLACGVNLTP